MRIPTLKRPRTGGNPMPDRLVAAVRWDFEYGLLSMAQCVQRYSTLVAPNTVRDICAGRLRPEIKASRFELLWK